MVMPVELKDFKGNGGSRDLVGLTWLAWLLGLDGLPSELKDFKGNAGSRKCRSCLAGFGWLV